MEDPSYCARVAGEILETERKYVGSLRLLYDVYYRQLLISCYYPKDKRVVLLEVVIKLFRCASAAGGRVARGSYGRDVGSNIEDILLINDALLTELESNEAKADLGELERWAKPGPCAPAPAPQPSHTPSQGARRLLGGVTGCAGR